MNSIKFSALLFDMDGTLIESISEVEEIWGQWCLRHGISLSSILEICHGVRTHDVLTQIAPHLDVAAECHILEEMELASNNSSAFPSVCEFLKDLGNTPWAVVTSASHQAALRRMQLCGLPEPKLLIGGDDVKNGKPDPEPFLIAAQRMGFPPEDCLVFEDSAAGIQSALAAGCQVIQIGASHLNSQVIAQVLHWQQIVLVGENRIEIKK